MTSYVFDFIGIAGFGSTIAGVYLTWGLPVALMTGGISALAFAIAKQRGN
ncbi:hypothetical protein VPHK394_0002 [Vibrio phage K394]